MSADPEFDAKIEQAVEKYLSRKTFDFSQRRNSNHEIVIDKIVEKERLLKELSGFFQQLARYTANELLEPVKHHIEQIEGELQKIKELVVKQMQEYNPLMSQEIISQPCTENGENSKELEKLKKKMQNQQNILNLILESQTQLKQAIHQNNGQSQVAKELNSDAIKQVVQETMDQRWEKIRKECSDMIVDGNRQIKEKSNACWVVLGDLNGRIESLEQAIKEQFEQKTPEKRSLLKKASALFHSK